jgi:transposase-like protein
MSNAYSKLAEHLERILSSESVRGLLDDVAKNATPKELAMVVAKEVLRQCPHCQDYTMNRNKKLDEDSRFCYWRCRQCGYMDKRPCCV